MEWSFACCELGRLPTSSTVWGVEIQVVRLDPQLPLPTYAMPGDAGCDLYARTGARIEPRGGRAIIPTGIRVAIPLGYAGFVQPRSGLALRHGVTVLNSPGLIDSGFRDEIGVILVNHGSAQFSVKRGARIAQLVMQPVETATFVEVAELP